MKFNTFMIIKKNIIINKTENSKMMGNYSQIVQVKEPIEIDKQLPQRKSTKRDKEVASCFYNIYIKENQTNK